MAVDKTKWVRGNNLADVDFVFDGTANKILVATAAGSSVKAAIDAAIAAIPADKYVNGLQGYNTTTNVLTLTLSDGSSVDIDMTALVADAVSSVGAATETTAGIAEIATQTEVNAGTDDSRIVTPAKLAAYVSAQMAAQVDVFGL